MEIFKKILCLSLVSLMMLALLLSGCAKENSSTGTGQPAASSGGGQTAAENKPEEKPVTLTWYYAQTPPADLQLVEDELNKQLKRKLPNTTLNMEPIDPGAYEDKINMMLSAQQEMDIIWTSNWLNPYVPNVMKGAYRPIDDLIDKYMPKTKASIPQYAWDSLKVNGKIYGVPNYQLIAGPWGIYVQKELADKYGLNLDSVKTIDDVEPFLQKVKENEPSIYPFNAGSNRDTSYLRPVIPSINKYQEIGGTPGWVATIDRTSSDLKVVNEYKLPEYKELLKKMNDWYKKGYIRKDIASVADNSADTKNNKYALGTSVISPGGDVLRSANQGKQYIEKALEEPWVGQLGAMSTVNAISNTSKNPERAAMLLELINTDKEFYNTICFGIENVHYKKVSDNPTVVEILPNSKYNPGEDWMFGNQFNAYYRKGQQPGIWEEADKMNREAKVSPLLGFTLNPDPIKNEIAAVTSVINEYKILELGAINDYEAKLNEFLTKLDAAGANKIVEEVQKQIDEWKKTK